MKRAHISEMYSHKYLCFHPKNLQPAVSSQIITPLSTTSRESYEMVGGAASVAGANRKAIGGGGTAVTTDARLKGHRAVVTGDIMCNPAEFI